MTSQYRHRRTSNPTVNFPNPIEPGEIAVNTANRQLVVGDAAAVGLGAPLPLLALRYFDTRAIYAAGDLIVYSQNIYRALAGTGPGAFTPANWEGLVGELSPEGFVLRAGDTMEGPLVLDADPADPLGAATKQYVDTWIGTKSTLFISESPPADAPDNALWWDSSEGALYVRYNDGDSTAWIAAMPMPDLSLFMLKAGGPVDGPITLPGDPTDPLHAATKQYVDAGDAAITALVDGKVNRSGDTMTGALTVSPSMTTASSPNGGTLYFGTSGARSISNDGTNFNTVGSNFIVNGDLVTHRGNNTGALFLNGAQTRYLHWDGGRYQLPGGPTGIAEPVAGGDAATVNYVNGRTPVVLNYVPVHQGGGAYQGANAVYIGWDGGGLRAQVDSTDLGRLVFGTASVSNGRLVYAGDGGMIMTIREPIANAIASGGSFYLQTSGDGSTGALISVTADMTMRFRHMQLYTTSWFTVGYV